MEREPSHTQDRHEGRVRRLLSLTLPRTFWLPIFGLVLTVGLTGLLLSAQTLTIPMMQAGVVAQQTIRVPRTITYVDSLATARARQAAAARVPPVVDIDSAANRASIASVQQLATLVQPSLTAHSTSQAQRLTALRRTLRNSPDAGLAATIAPLKVATWNTAVAIVLAQLRATTNPHQAVIASAMPGVIARSASTAGLNAQQHIIVKTLLTTYLHPNARVNASATRHERSEAASQVAPVMATLQAGQIIVRSGDVVTAQIVEYLQALRANIVPLGLSTAAGTLLLVALLVLILFSYLACYVPVVASSPRRLALLDLVILVTVAAARLIYTGNPTFAYAFPAAVASILIAVLLDAGLGLIVATVIALLLGQMLGNSFEMTLYYFCSGIMAALAVRKVRRLNQFFVAGIWTCLCCLAMIMTFQVLLLDLDPFQSGPLFLAAVINGGLAATLSLGSFGGLGAIFGVTTALQLLELSHPDHPLLRRLMLQAPGTYHHSLMIGNLAERAAEQIGADALIARVMAYYHDIGKLYSPTYFSENQMAIPNIHDTLTPEESARLIRQHVLDGLKLARQYHLPAVIREGIAEHHGLNMVGYFYHQAMQEHPDHPLNILEFTYPGPKPQSKETAILMLADGVEAAARAVDTSDPSVLAQVIHKVIYDRLLDGQLDECGLSMRDLTVIERSFVTVLRGVSHPRIKYPEQIGSAGTPIEAKA